jgi:hypothetical protein
MLLPDLSPVIRGLEKGKMCGGVARAHEKSPLVTKQRPQNVMTPDKKPSAAEKFSPKFSRCIKNATPAVTNSLVMPVR